MIRHGIGSYVNGMIHGSTVGSAFSLLEAWGIVGNLHKVSIKNWQRYLNEVSYRFNRCSDNDGSAESATPSCRDIQTIDVHLPSR